jgi:putative NADH-flavin reductase
VRPEEEIIVKLVVFGSTGGVGRRIVAQALGRGDDVVAFARSPKKIDRNLEHLLVAEGDVLQYATVERAVRGQDAVLCTLGMPITDKSRLRTNGTRNIVRAMQETGVKRLVCLSSLGVGDSRGVLPFLYRYLIAPLVLRSLLADHEAQENHIRSSGLDWIIVRPANLTDGERTGAYQHGFTTKRRDLAFRVSRADVADFMLKQVVADTYLHKTPSLSY